MAGPGSAQYRRLHSDECSRGAHMTDLSDRYTAGVCTTRRAWQIGDAAPVCRAVARLDPPTRYIHRIADLSFSYDQRVLSNVSGVDASTPCAILMRCIVRTDESRAALTRDCATPWNAPRRPSCAGFRDMRYGPAIENLRRRSPLSAAWLLIEALSESPPLLAAR